MDNKVPWYATLTWAELRDCVDRSLSEDCWQAAHPAYAALDEMERRYELAKRLAEERVAVEQPLKVEYPAEWKEATSDE